jgi:hypothetical protein
VTPAPFVANSFLAILDHFAPFDEQGQLQDGTGSIEIRFSRSLLDRAGIASISVDAETMAHVRAVILTEVRKSAHLVGQRGSSTCLGDNRRSFDVDLNEAPIVQYSLSTSEFSEISRSLIDNGISHLNSHGYWLIGRVDRSVVVLGTGGLTSVVGSSWDRLDAANRVVWSGGSPLMQGLKQAAQDCNPNGASPGLSAPDPVYVAFGLNESNNWGETGETGNLAIVFR